MRKFYSLVIANRLSELLSHVAILSPVTSVYSMHTIDFLINLVFEKIISHEFRGIGDSPDNLTLLRAGYL